MLRPALQCLGIKPDTGTNPRHTEMPSSWFHLYEGEINAMEPYAGKLRQ